MSNTNTGGPAFPTNRVNMNGEVVPDEEGMTLRDYFAAKAMDRLLELWHRDLSKDGQELRILGNDGGSPVAIAEEAYAMADAMLKAREV